MEQKRKESFILGTLSSYLFNIISVTVTFISVPVGLKYFGVERYGAMAIISTLLMYLSVTNFGINGAAAILSAKALDKLERLKIVAKSFVLILVFSSLFLACILVFSQNKGWVSALGRIPLYLFDEVHKAAWYAAILFLINLPLSLFPPIFGSIQKVHIGKIYETLSLILGLIVLILTVMLRQTLTFYFISRGILVIIASIIGVAHFIFFENTNRGISQYRLRDIFAPAANPEFSTLRILVTGLRLFIISLAAMIVWHTDNFVISYFKGLGAVTPYSITFRFVTSAFVLFTTLNITLNPMYGNAFALKNYQWIEGTYNRIASIQQILSGFVWIASIVFAEVVIKAWAGDSAYAGILTVFALGGYGYSLSLVHTHSGLLTSINEIRNGILIGWSEALANLILSLIFVNYLGIGGVALGTFLAAILTVFWMVPFEIRRRTGGQVKFDHLHTRKHFLMNIFPSISAVLLLHYSVQSVLLRILAGILVLILYVVFSYKGLKAETKDAVVRIYSKFKLRALKNAI